MLKIIVWIELFSHLKYVLMLNWIVWNRNVFDIEPVCKRKTILILNWIVWNKTFYIYINGFGLK